MVGLKKKTPKTPGENVRGHFVCFFVGAPPPAGGGLPIGVGPHTVMPAEFSSAGQIK